MTTGPSPEHAPTAITDADRAAIDAALVAIDPDRPARTVERLGRGNRKRTYLVERAGAETLVVARSGTSGALATETALLRAIRARTDLPVPRVIHWSGDRRSEPDDADGSTLVTAYVPGRTLHERFVDLEPATRRSVANRFGAALATLHETFAFEAVGRLRPDDGLDGLVVDSESDWLDRYADTQLARLPAEFDDLRQRLAAAVEALDPATESRLYPWDLRPGNALVADGEVSAFLDFEEPLAAPAALSVAKAEFLLADWYLVDEAGLREAFRSGYASCRALPTVEPGHRVLAIAASAVDSAGVVTEPGYPRVDRETAVAFHRGAFRRALGDSR